MLKLTGERYLPYVEPEISGAEIHYEHLHRYMFAKKFVKDKKVLDLGSGEGYGSFILAEDAELVIGVDTDEEAVEHAIGKYSKDNLKFLCGDVTKVPLDGEKIFDVIVCFEVVEHLDEVGQVRMMEEVKRLIKEDGILIISTPNKKIYSDELNYKNPFHKREMYLDEFDNLLRRYFKNVFHFGQRVYAGSHIWPISGTSEASEEFLIERGDSGFNFTSQGKEALYFIAIASNADINLNFARSYLIDVSNTIFHYSIPMLKLRNKIKVFSGEFQSIKASFTWRSVMKLHSLIERIAPPGTRRGRWYYLAIIGLNTIINEGFSSFWRKFMLYTFKRGSYPISPTVPLLEVDVPYSPLLESLDLTKELKITFTSKADKLREVRILTAAHRGSSDLELLVEVDGELKRRAVLKGRYVLSDGYTSFKFKPINGCEGKNITLRLRSLGEPPTIVPLDRRIALKDIGLYYDGRGISGGIGLKLLYDVRGVNIYHLWIKKNEPDESRLREMR
ncbi:MAG: class I SAM-dependent methyltransferase, partial [Candidatus Korarchaeum sp.]